MKRPKEETRCNFSRKRSFVGESQKVIERCLVCVVGFALVVGGI